MRDYITLVLWVLVVGGVFLYLWRKGYLLRLGTYIAETREELRKCTWPSLDELKGSTLVVMITIAMLAIFTVLSDFILLKIIRGILPKL